MEDVEGPVWVAVEESDNDRKVQAKLESDTILVLYKFRRGTVVLQD